MDYKTFISDIRTYRIMSGNENYAERLKEAYLELKRLNVNDFEDFSTREDLKVGAFTYQEITVFDRIGSKEYQEVLNDAWFDIHNQTEEYRNNPNIGDQLASWGTLGKTPYREQLIEDGHIIIGLTQEESDQHFGR